VAGDLSILRGREFYGRAPGDPRCAPSPATHGLGVGSTVLPFQSRPIRGRGPRLNSFQKHRLRRVTDPSGRLLAARSIGSPPAAGCAGGTSMGNARAARVGLPEGPETYPPSRPRKWHPTTHPEGTQLLTPAHPGGVFAGPFCRRNLTRRTTCQIAPGFLCPHPPPARGGASSAREGPQPGRRGGTEGTDPPRPGGSAAAPTKPAA